MCLACQVCIKRKCSHAHLFTFWKVKGFLHSVLQSTRSVCQYRLFALVKGRLLKAKVNQGKLIYQFKLKHGDDGLALLSSPIDRRLSRDLVVVSHWEAGQKPSTSPKNNTPWRNKAPKSKSEESELHGNLTLNERFTKLQSPISSSQEPKERRSSGSPEKTLRKPGTVQRPNFRPTSEVKRGSAPDGVTRKPLMGPLIPRPPFNQKPVFKKSQSIMSKYKNLQTLRHKVPHQRQATSYRRW